MSEEKCDCVNELDKLRMDLEQSGEHVSFIAYVFRGEGEDMDMRPIVHKMSIEKLFTASGAASRAANKMIDEGEQEARGE